MVYITGDTHGDFTRFTKENFPEQIEMTKNDYVIVCGDFGGIWFVSEDISSEKERLDWLQSLPFTMLFVSGNHENYDRLKMYPEKMWHGGKVHVIRPSILHLMNGQIFEIENNLFFVFGGASSHDICDGILNMNDSLFPAKKAELDKNPLSEYRINHVSWWKEEIPSKEEMEAGMKNLERRGYQVDYILTHSPYTTVLKQMDGGAEIYKPDILTDYLEKVKMKTEYKQWVFAHMHVNQAFLDDKAVCIYEQIARLP